MSATYATATEVQKSYLAYFGRPADVAGLNYWIGKTSAAMDAGFSASTEYAGLYAGMTNVQRVEQVYHNLLGRASDAAGSAYWTNALNNGSATVSSLVTSMQNNALGVDTATIANRTTYATLYTASMDTPAEIQAYTGDAVAAAARSAVSAVTYTDASLTTARTTIAADIAAVNMAVAPAVAASTAATAAAAAAAAAADAAAFKVTNDGSGNYTVGTSHGNVAVAVSGSNYVFTPTTGSAVSVATAGTTSLIVNTITLTGTAADLTGETITGTGTVAVTALDATAAANLSNITATSVTAAVSGNVTFTGNLGTAVTTVAGGSTLTATAAVVNGETINGLGTVAVTALNATPAADLSTITATSVTAAVSGNVTFTGNLGTAVTTVADGVTMTAAYSVLNGKTINHDGTEAAQALVVTIAAAAAAADLSTITSNITNLTANFTETQTFTGNLGTAVATVADGVTMTAAYSVLNGKTINHDGTEAAQALVVTIAAAAAAADLSTITSNITNLTANFTETQTFTGNLNSKAAVLANNVTVTAAVADITGDTITDSGANSMLVVTGMAADTDFGTALTNVTLNGGGTSVVVAYVAANLTMSTGNFTGVEVININTGATLTMNGGATGFGLFGLTNQVISGAGNMVLNTTAGNDTFNLSGITQSSFTGTLTINASDGIDTFTATSGNDIINCGVGADVVNGGAGNDTINGSDGADNLTGGAGADILSGEVGADIFFFAAADFTATNGTELVTGMDTITDFLIDGFDLIRFSDNALIVSTHAAAAVVGTANIVSGYATFHVDDDTLAERLAAVVTAVATDAAGTSVAFATPGAPSYLFVVGNAAAGIQSGDALIKLTGINATGLTLNGTDISAFA